MGSERKRQEDTTWNNVAKGLGWFSIGLGAAEMLAASAMVRFTGVRNSFKNRMLMRGYGIREMGAGFGILFDERPENWMWARVAGDFLDIGSLLSAARSAESSGGRIAMSMASVAGVTALDIYCAAKLSAQPEPRTARDAASRTASHSAIITIDRPADELYTRLRDFMRMRGEGGESRIFASGVEISEDSAARLLRWSARPGPGISVVGTVRFEPARSNRGTVVRAQLESPSNGAVARIAGKLFGIAGAELLQNELRKFKQLVETGEIATSEATAVTGMHEAQPPREPVHA
jgi:uncharacterized membrane protein